MQEALRLIENLAKKEVLANLFLCLFARKRKLNSMVLRSSGDSSLMCSEEIKYLDVIIKEKKNKL